MFSVFGHTDTTTTDRHIGLMNFNGRLNEHEQRGVWTSQHLAPSLWYWSSVLSNVCRYIHFVLTGRCKSYLLHLRAPFQSHYISHYIKSREVLMLDVSVVCCSGRPGSGTCWRKVDRVTHMQLHLIQEYKKCLIWKKKKKTLEEHSDAWRGVLCVCFYMTDDSNAHRTRGPWWRTCVTSTPADQATCTTAITPRWLSYTHRLCAHLISPASDCII